MCTDKDNVSNSINECNRFENVLLKIEYLGISSLSELLASSHHCLYDDLKSACCDLADYMLKTRSDKYRKDQKGNFYKVLELKNLFGIEREDVVQECTIKLLKNLSKILSKPITYRYPYACCIVNNLVRDIYRYYLRHNLPCISLEDSLSLENESKRIDFVAANNKTPESVVCETERMEELLSVIHKKLGPYPARLMSFLACSYGKRPPRCVAEDIRSRGLIETYKDIINDTFKEFPNDALALFSSDFDEETLRETLSQDFHIDSDDNKEIAKKISYLQSRAVYSLKKELCNR